MEDSNCNCLQLHGTGYLEESWGHMGRRQKETETKITRSQSLMKNSKYVGKGKPIPSKAGSFSAEPVQLLPAGG